MTGKSSARTRFPPHKARNGEMKTLIVVTIDGILFY